MNAHRFKVYQDAAGEWRWRLQGPNGRILAYSAEGYTRKRDALRAVARTVKAAVLAVVIE